MADGHGGQPDPAELDPAQSHLTGSDPTKSDPTESDPTESDPPESDPPEWDPNQPGTGEVTATVIVAAPAEKVFAAFLAWERQGEWIPLTKVRIVSGDGGVGTTLEAVTTLGPAVLRDEMRVDRVDAPYEVRVVHYGQLLRGPGVLRCTPLAGNRTQLVWHEWFQLPTGMVGRVAWPVLWPGSKLSLNYALRRFARLVETGALP